MTRCCWFFSRWPKRIRKTRQSTSNCASCPRRFWGKSWENIAALFGDNCSTKKSFARRFGPLFVRRLSHQYNVAMKYFICDSEEILDCVPSLIRKLSYQISAVRLGKETTLQAELDNGTQWNSTFEMFKRFLDLYYVLPTSTCPKSTICSLTPSLTRRSTHSANSLQTSTVS